MASVKEIIFRLLSRRSYFTHELRRKLVEKGFDRQEIEKALDEVQKLGYINDEEKARLFVESRKARGYGPKWIEHQLQTKGYSSETKISVQDQLEQLRHLREKRYAKLNLHNPKERQKLLNAFLRRGFSFEVCLNFLNGL